jgi:hypothetical protein
MNNGNWIQTANMNYPRGYATTCVVGESLIYIAGGYGPYEVDGVLII